MIEARYGLRIITGVNRDVFKDREIKTRKIIRSFIKEASKKMSPSDIKNLDKRMDKETGEMGDKINISMEEISNKYYNDHQDGIESIKKIERELIAKQEEIKKERDEKLHQIRIEYAEKIKAKDKEDSIIWKDLDRKLKTIEDKIDLEQREMIVTQLNERMELYLSLFKKLAEQYNIKCEPPK